MLLYKVLGGRAGEVFLHCSTSAWRFCYIIKVYIVIDINTQEKEANKRTAWSKLSRALWRRGGKRKESLQLRLWDLNSTCNSPVAPGRLSSQISGNQREAKTSANATKHWKTRAKGNGVITNVISANQHFASTFSMQIFKFQRRSCKLSFLFPPCPGELARRLTRGKSKFWTLHQKQWWIKYYINDYVKSWL